MKKYGLLACLLFITTACTGIPEGVQAVPSVQPERYLGTWYEIVRLDHSFERGLEKVTATYTQNSDGSIKVLNRGYNPEKNEWESAEGKALFIDPAKLVNSNQDNPSQVQTRTGRLKVSFFGPFYSSYNIIALDTDNYQYAMIAGPNHAYFWVLSRNPKLDKTILDRLLKQARALGFATEELIYVKQ
jgi:apolipoprotein D and lipocalin family protein